jgi:hypothetical protein
MGKNGQSVSKELSVATIEAFKKNRVKAAELKDGQEIVTFVDGRLYLGTVVRCDECPNISTINGGNVLASTSELLLQAKQFCQSSMLLGPGAIGCYDQDGSGDILCPACTKVREDKSSGIAPTYDAHTRRLMDIGVGNIVDICLLDIKEQKMLGEASLNFTLNLLSGYPGVDLQKQFRRHVSLSSMNAMIDEIKARLDAQGYTVQKQLGKATELGFESRSDIFKITWKDE